MGVAGCLFYKNYTSKIVSYSHELKLRIVFKLKFESEIPLRNVFHLYEEKSKGSLPKQQNKLSCCFTMHFSLWHHARNKIVPIFLFFYRGLLVRGRNWASRCERKSFDRHRIWESNLWRYKLG